MTGEFFRGPSTHNLRLSIMQKPGGMLLCLLLVGGCASQTQPQTATLPGVTAVTPEQSWQQRQQQFARMTSWQLQGKVGVQFRDQSASFGLSWSQQGKEQYSMDIKNPLTGAVMAWLKGSSSEVTLQAGGKTYRDTSAEQLLRNHVGVALPLDGMKYWVRGVPAPGVPVQKLQLDNQGRPVLLQQSGWQIEYTAWQGADTLAMPDKINLTRAAENARVKVLAKEWQTRF